MNKWQEALGLMETRDVELGEAFEKISKIKENVFNAQVELKEQTGFLENENVNMKEINLNIKTEEHRAQVLQEELDKAEAELRELQSEITLEKRQMWKVGSEIDSKRVRMKATKVELAKKTKYIEQLSSELHDLQSKKVSGNNRALTAEERAGQTQRLLDHEQLQHDMTKLELDKARERLLAKKKDFKDLIDEEDTNAIQIQALMLEQTNLNKQINTKKEMLIAREDIAVSSDQKLASIEREIARVKGIIADENRVELKARLDIFKVELSARQAEKRNMDHMVHKMMAEVKRVAKEIKTIDTNCESVNKKLEEVQLVNETCDREHKILFDKVEALLLEEKMLKLTEKRAKEELEQLNVEIMDLRKEDLEINEQLREQRADMESKKELYTAQSRCLKDELSTIRSEIRSRQDRTNKLKIRYEHTVKALGPVNASIRGDGGSMPSHAKHMVQVAQEKAELAEKSEVLAEKIKKEEEEMEKLEKAMKLLKHSNDKYRSSNCRASADVNSDKTKELEAEVKDKEATIRRLKQRLSELSMDINQVEYLVDRASKEQERLGSVMEAKSVEVVQLEKELRDQEKKLYRARVNIAKLSGEIKDLLPNPDTYEHDMDLREEKEKQRTALIRLREISNVDQSFQKKVHEELAKLNLCIPPVSRLEARATSSRTITRPSTMVSTGVASSAGSRGIFRPEKEYVSDSVLVMDLSEATGSGRGGGRSKTAVPTLA